MSSKPTGQSGLSLIELITVLGIIALISAVAIPQYTKFSARSRMAEAKSALKAIHTLQLSYYGDFDRYGVVAPYGKLADGSFACDINDIEFRLPGCGSTSSKIRYWFEVTTASSGGSYSAIATGRIVEGCNTADVWEIREDGQLRHTTNAPILCQ